MLSVGLLLLSAWLVTASTHHVSLESTINTTISSLDALTAEYAVLKHSAFPKHSIRIRKTEPGWCDSTVTSYSGYIDVTEAKHYFFYFFESRDDPGSDDVVFWTNGGPGGSSALGLFMELGPCSIKDETGPKFNPYSWNEKANIFFVDQPIGVGFSYADYGEYVSTTEEAAVDIAAFVAIFFSTFKKFSGRGFHMAGESYGGRYVPVYASAVYDQNRKLEAAGIIPINLKSVIIGNGFTDFYRMIPSYYDITCTPASMEPLLPIATCVRMKTVVPRCQRRMQESCVDVFDTIDCNAAVDFCHQELTGPLLDTGKNMYDISRDCEGEQDIPCYPVTTHIAAYLNQPSIRTMLGVSPDLTNITYSPVNFTVSALFRAASDEYRTLTQYYLEALLDRGIRVLIYAGTYDYICNWVGNLRMVEALEWSGSAEFKDKELQEWSLSLDSETRAGLFKTGDGLTYLTVDAAGHMVPHDKPAEGLKLLERWLANEEFHRTPI